MRPGLPTNHETESDHVTRETAIIHAAVPMSVSGSNRANPTRSHLGITPTVAESYERDSDE